MRFRLEVDLNHPAVRARADLELQRILLVLAEQLPHAAVEERDVMELRSLEGFRLGEARFIND